MTPIKGDFAQIYLRESGTTEGFKVVGCTTGDTFNDTTEMAEVTGLTSDFVEFKPTYKSATLSTDALLIYADGGQMTVRVSLTPTQIQEFVLAENRDWYIEVTGTGGFEWYGWFQPQSSLTYSPYDLRQLEFYS